MKKKLLVLALLLSGLLAGAWGVLASSKVTITAFVAGANTAPIVLSVNPNVDVNPLPKNSSQNYSIYFSDQEKDAVTYTVTPAYGYVNPTSGTVVPSAYDSASGAYIRFTHLTPSSTPATNPYSVTVTINDGTNTTATSVNIYAY